MTKYDLQQVARSIGGIPNIEDPYVIRPFLEDIYCAIPHNRMEESVMLQLSDYVVLIDTMSYFSEIKTNLKLVKLDGGFMDITWTWDEEGYFGGLKTTTSLKDENAIQAVMNEVNMLLKLTKGELHPTISPASIFEDEEDEDE